MIEDLDFRFGTVLAIKAFSENPSSPRRKYCIINVEFPDLKITRQSVGQFAHHTKDMLGETVLCLVNLGSRTIFGQTSELLILGVPHPNGSVSSCDLNECQATFLRPIPLSPFSDRRAFKEQVHVDEWMATEIRLTHVISQSPSGLQVSTGAENWSVPLLSALPIQLIGQQLIVFRDQHSPTRGTLLAIPNGDLLLAQPALNSSQVGTRVY